MYPLRTLLILLLFNTFSVFCQEDPDTTNRALAPLVQEAEALLLNNKLDKAKQRYQEALRIKDDYLPALRGLAAVFELQNNYEAAVERLVTITQINPRFSRVIYYDIGQIYYRIGEYAKALDYFQQYATLSPLPFTEFGLNGDYEQGIHTKYQHLLPGNIRQCIVAMDSIKYLNIAEVNNLGKSINTSGDELFPFLTNDQRRLYFTRRMNQNDDEDLYVSIRDSLSWQLALAADSSFNTPLNEGMTTMTRDNRSLFFTACKRAVVLGTCDIMRADVDSFNITCTRELPGWAMSEYWESQASISCDGQLLYFASNRKGGIGGTDIWMSQRQADGTWGDAKNLGRPINTKNDEEAPFITNDGKVLYFSSTGHLGLGEQDVFMSRADTGGRWGFPINLGPPVNTAYRELGFFLSADGYTGYFASNRPAGAGQMDIYHFQLSEAVHSEAITFVEGFVKDSITLQPVETTLYPKGHAPVRTDEEGRFFLCLPAESRFDFEINESTYFLYRKNIAVPRWENKDFFPVNILLQPILPPAPVPSIVSAPPVYTNIVDSVYFAFDQAVLDQKEKAKLQDLLDSLSVDNLAHIEITGYCDHLGTNDYNLKLSHQRAAVVGAFLIKQGCDPGQIRIEGKGEIGSDKQRSRNRRVEVKIIYQ